MAKTWIHCKLCKYAYASNGGGNLRCGLRATAEDGLTAIKRRERAAEVNNCDYFEAKDPTNTPQRKQPQPVPVLTSEEVKPQIFLADEAAAANYTAQLSALLVDPQKPEPEPETLLSLEGTPVLWRGGKSFICAVAKARKTTTLTLFAAILCGRDEEANGFKSFPGCKVLYIDTEQARTDSQRILFRVAALCGKEPQAINLRVLSLNKQSPEDIKGLMEAAVIAYAPDVVILDNWTDCVTSIMDDEECTKFSRQLRMLAEAYNLAVFSVIHANESARNDDKPNFRGWGAEEARKSDLTLFLKDMGDYSQATFGRCRGKRPGGFAVGHNAEGLPCFISKTEAPTTNPDKYAQILAKIPATGITWNDLRAIIVEQRSLTPDSAKRWIKEMKTAAVIVENNGLYYKPSDNPKQEDKLPF